MLCEYGQYRIGTMFHNITMIKPEYGCKDWCILPRDGVSQQPEILCRVPAWCISWDYSHSAVCDRDVHCVSLLEMMI